ncbi:MAG: helix-turn-helix domain-containing protein [Candidatus Asgardarchaeia archaeon]
MDVFAQNLKLESLRKRLEVISEKNRFGLIAVFLSVDRPLSFSELLKITELNPGTLTNHLKKLEEVGIIEKVKKSNWKRNESRSYYKLTKEGLELLEQTLFRDIIDDLKKWRKGETLV